MNTFLFFILAICLIGSIDCGTLFNKLCRNSTFEFNGIEINGYHQLAVTQGGLDTEFVDKILKRISQVEKNYLLAEIIESDYLQRELYREDLKRDNLTFVFGNQAKSYYGKQIFKLSRLKIEYQPKAVVSVVDYSIFIPTNDKNYEPVDENCVDGQTLTLLFAKKKIEDHGSRLLLILIGVIFLASVVLLGFLLYRFFQYTFK